MQGFTNMEVAALRSIFAETPKMEAALLRQLDSGRVIKRENSGGGFFTYIDVPDEIPAVLMEKILGVETHVRMPGINQDLGVIVFLSGGRLSMLECYAYAPDHTQGLDPIDLTFEIVRSPVHRIG